MKKLFKYFSVILLLTLTFSGIAQSLQKDMEYLASDKLEGREFGSAGEVTAAKYLAKRFKKIGLEPKGTNGYMQEFSIKRKFNPHAKVPVDTSVAAVGSNVIGFIDNGAPTTVVLGAHFDHLGYGAEGSLYKGDEMLVHNGADDNASGTTLLLQLADALIGKYPHNNYLIIAFTGEEKGLWGSNWFVKHPTIDLSTVNYMLNMDMVGRLKNDKTLEAHGSGTSPTWLPMLKSIAEEKGFKLKSIESGVGRTDHTSFYLKNLPVLQFSTGGHQDYHRPTDDFDKINYEGIKEIEDFILDIIAQCDSQGKLEFTKTKDEDSKKAPKYSVTLGVMPDYSFAGPGMLITSAFDGRPAKNAGMQDGDIVMKMGDFEVKNMMGYMEALGKFKKGDKTKVIIKRGDKEIEVEVEF